MKIKSVIEKRVIIINGKEYVREITNWTTSVKEASENGIVFDEEFDIVEWIEEA